MIFLDSACPDQAQQAFATGFVHGITTNPALIAATGRPARDVIGELCDASNGLVFYQLTGSTPAERRAEAEDMLLMRLGRVGLKVGCTYENLVLARSLIGDGATIGITAIFSAAQARLACEVGAHYVLPYVNRSSRLLGDGPGLVCDMRAIIDGAGATTEILAASVKSSDEAATTLLSGAHHLTLPLPVIRAMAQHDLSDAALADFAEQSRRGSTGA